MIGILGGSALILRLILGHPHLPSVTADSRKVSGHTVG